MSRHPVKLGLLLLVGGAIVNVSVAWASALWIWPGDGLPQDLIGWMSDPALASGNNWVVSSKKGISFRRLLTGVADVQRGISDEAKLFPSWSDMPERMRDRSQQAAQVVPDSKRKFQARPVAIAVDARGWPCLTLQCQWDYGTTHTPPPGGKVLSNGWKLTPYQPDNPGTTDPLKQRALPNEIIWFGFGINTIFYGVVLWMMFAIPMALRRRWRNKRNLCPSCAYPIGTSEICTECGKPVSPRAS